MIKNVLFIFLFIIFVSSSSFAEESVNFTELYKVLNKKILKDKAIMVNEIMYIDTTKINNNLYFLAYLNEELSPTGRYKIVSTAFDEIHTDYDRIDTSARFCSIQSNGVIPKVGDVFIIGCSDGARNSDYNYKNVFIISSKNNGMLIEYALSAEIKNGKLIVYTNTDIRSGNKVTLIDPFYEEIFKIGNNLVLKNKPLSR